MCRGTGEGVLVQLLEVGRSWRRSVDHLAVVDVGLREKLHGLVGPVPVLDGPWKQPGEGSFRKPPVFKKQSSGKNS